MKKKFIIITIFIFTILICYLSIRVIVAFNRGYSFAEMDWNQDGETTIFEMIIASDIGKRIIISDNSKCCEYYSFKDGLTIKIICSKNI